MRRPVRRWIRWAGLATVALWVSWFGGVNLILALHLIPWAINEHNPVVTLDYASAWTLWPGTVHLRGFTLRGRDREHLEFSFNVDRAYAVVDLPVLRHRVFHATHVEIDGLDSRFRTSFDPGDLALAQGEQALLPPIPGYADPPMKQLGPVAMPIDDAHDRNWTVELSDVDIQHLRQLWVQQLRFRLEVGHITGRFAIHPERAFDLDLTSLEFGRARLTIGADSVLRGLDGTLAGTVERFDPRTIDGYDFLHFVSSRMDAKGALSNLRFLRSSLPGWGITGGGGSLQGVMVIDHGVLAEGTQLVVRSNQLVLRKEHLQLAGPLSVEARITGEAGRGRGEVELKLSPVALSLRSDRRARVMGPSLRIHASSEALDLVDPFRTGQLELDADRLVASLAPWVDQATDAVIIESGDLTAQVHLSMELPSTRGKGHLRLHSDRVSTRLKGQEMSATTEGNVILAHFDLRAETLELSGSDLALTAKTAPSFDRQVEGWWVKAELDQALLTFHPTTHFDGALQVHARDARPILDFLSEVGSLPHVVSDALTLPNLEGRAQAHFTEGTLSFSPIRVTSGNTEVLGTTSLGDAVTATLLVRSGPLAVGLDVANHHVSVNLLHGQALLDRALLLAAVDGGPL